MRYILITALVAACAALLALAAYRGFQSPPITSEAATAADSKPGRDAETAEVNKAPLQLPLIEPEIVVSKAGRQLALYSAGKVVRLYRIGLGSNPTGDKVRQGDGRTPEGRFYVCVKNANSSYYLSLGLSYPNKDHAERGLRDRLIGRAEYNQIVDALERKVRPPWGTRLGGEIFIHGNGSASDWTLGCVALDNGDMKELFYAVAKGTIVTIRP